jgi:hypothetical protein
MTFALSSLAVRQKTAADLANAAKVAHEVLPGAQERARLADMERRAAVLAGDERAIQRAEMALGRARLDLERAEIVANDLAERAVLAEAAEAEAAINAIRDKAEATSKAMAEKLRKTYGRLAGPLVALLAEAEAADKAVEAANDHLRGLGRYEATVSLPSRRAFTVPALADPRTWNPVNLTSIMPVPGAGGGFGAALREAEGMGWPTK